MAFMLVINGADPEDFTDDEWQTAIEHLEEVVASGQVRRFTGNDYIRDLKSGNLAACMAWSGDVAAAEDDRIPFVQPEAMEKIDPSLVENNLIFPSDEFLATTRDFMVLDEATRKQYEADFSRASGG